MNAQIQSDEFAVVLLNEEGTIIDAHESSREALGWDRTELQGKDIREILQVGRDLVVEQLLQLQEEDASANSSHTSFSVRVLARRKDQSHFPARVTVRRFTQLGCWTAAFYRVTADSETDFTPTVSPEEIELANNTPAKKPETAANKKGESPVEARPKQKLFRSVNLFLRKSEQPPAEPTPPVNREEKRVPEARPAPTETVCESKPATVTPPVKSPELPRERNENERGSAQATPAPGRITAELEKERAERKRSEQRIASLSEQLQQLHRQLSENLESERSCQTKIADAEQRLEEFEGELQESRRALKDEQHQRELDSQELTALKELNSRLETDLSALELSHTEIKKGHEELLVRLEAGLASITNRDSELQKAVLERQRLENDLATTQRELRDTTEKNGVEHSRLQLALETSELERKRLEQEVLRSRLAAISSARESGALLLDVREKAKQPLNELSDAAAEFLHSEGTDEHKELAANFLKSLQALKTALDGAVPLPQATLQAEPEVRAA